MADELLDIVDDQDQVVGQEMRSAVHQQGLQHRGVHVLLFDADGRMLVQKRSADRANSPSLLDCSVSEHVKAGESYLDAAIRGMKEELGMEMIDLKPLGKIRMEYGPNDLEISQIYEGRIISEQVRFDPIEISEIRYLSLDEIRAGIQDEKGQFCLWFVELMKWYFGESANLIVMPK